MTQASLLPVAEAEVIRFEVKCSPKGTPRPFPGQPKISKKTGKWFTPMITPDTADGFKEAIQLVAGRYRGRMHDGPVRISINVFFARTEKVWRKNARTKVLELVEINHLPPDAPDGAVPMWQKPDLDNVKKAVLDALGDIKLFAIGDEQVWRGDIDKWWTAKGSPPGVRIEIVLEPRPEWKKKPKKKGP